MSHYMTALAMQQIGLKPATKIVLYWIADHYNHETHKCFPSHKRLADLCEMSRQSVINHIAILQEQGLIKATNRTRENGSNTSCEYQLLFKQADIQNLDTPYTKSVHGDVDFFDNHNLVNNNLVSEPKDHADLDFDRFYGVYPRRIGKGAARQAFTRAIKKKPAQLIIEAAHEFACFCKQMNIEKKFIPHPTTWLNQERWDDELQKEQGPKTTTDVLNGLFNGGILGIESK